MGRTGPRRVAGRAVGRRVGGQRWRSGHQKAVNSDIIVFTVSFARAPRAGRKPLSCARGFAAASGLRP